MRTLIYNTQARAKNAAKASAIRYAEKQLGINYSPNTEKRLKLNKNWLIKYTETQCVCGQTGAIEAVLFHRGQQFSSLAGYCNFCGSEYPMP